MDRKRQRQREGGCSEGRERRRNKDMHMFQQYTFIVNLWKTRFPPDFSKVIFPIRASTESRRKNA
jgi:hypothetical protein